MTRERDRERERETERDPREREWVRGIYKSQREAILN
jgi:hypothetical protein